MVGLARKGRLHDRVVIGIPWNMPRYKGREFDELRDPQDGPPRKGCKTATTTKIQIIVSATTSTAASHHHLVHILIGHACRIQFPAGSHGFRLPQATFKPVQSAPQAQELIRFEFLGSSNDLVDSSHVCISPMNKFRLAPRL